MKIRYIQYIIPATALLTAVGVFYVFALSLTPKAVVHAGSNDNVFGWAWSDTIGWISMNSSNCDADNNGQSDGSPLGCPASGTAIPSYGVSINENTGEFSGYAWSENVGWIDFSPSATPPGESGPNPAHLNGTTVEGWARVVSQTTSASPGFWDGWIKMSDTASPSYGVQIASSGSTRDFSGYAWGSEVVGWINFDNVTSNVVYALQPSGNIWANGVADNITVGSTTDITLTWNSQNADSCTVDTNGLSGTENTTGANIGPLTSDKLISLHCSNGSYFSDVLVDTVQVTVSDGGIPSISVDPKIAHAGDSVSVDYNTNLNDPANCTIDGPNSGFPQTPSATSGSIQITAEGVGTYSIDCPGGSAQVDLQVVPQGWES